MLDKVKKHLCLLDIAGKILEQIVHGKIKQISEKHLSDYHCGFCKDSTLHTIDLGFRIVKDAFAVKI